MNGDVGKLPSGAVSATSPEPHSPTTASSINDFSALNGVVDPQGVYTDAAPVGGGAPEAGPAPAPGPALPPPLDNAAAPATTPVTPAMPLDQLKQMLSSQLEYYFSRENLANDAYLLSQMDNDQYVPIWTVANFNQVKKLTKDIKLITEVLRESPNVQVDEEGQKVRPSHKRCIVILREIPDSTPLEEVKGLFSGKGCPKLISCEFAHNNSWYVTFENDEDAQKAYRFLREEVREFQGKPIMARIKAKPMNRLPIPPVVSPMGTMKNGYRPAQPSAAAAAPAFDPSAAAAYPPQQRPFIYNGSVPPVTYPVQIYTFPQQPFYSGTMIPHWGPTSPAYFEFGSVFSVNGLAPQTPFPKAQGSRFVSGSRNNRNKRSEHRSSVSESSSSRYVSNKGSVKTSEPHLSHMGNASITGATSKSFYQRDMAQESEESISRLSDSVEGFVQPILVSKDSIPPRRRRKEDEPRVSASSPAPGAVCQPAPGAQFDLEDEAFPPLPVAAPQPPPAPVEPAPEAGAALAPPGGPPAPPAHNRENRLSDVVKGTAKVKLSNSSISISSCNTKEKESGSPRPGSPTPSQASPPPQTLPPLPTPPLTPDKTVPAAATAKCCTADKSTKTDDMVVNGAASEASGPAADSSAIVGAAAASPATTNAATMTDAQAAQAQPALPSAPPQNECSGNLRLSYAQVAQHAKDGKQQAAERIDKLTITTSIEEEKKEAFTLATGQTSPRAETTVAQRPIAVGRGIGSARLDRNARRRDPNTLLRFNSRPRSPK